MEEPQEYELVENKEDHYLIREKGGTKTFKAFKIDMDKIKESNDESNRKVAKKFSFEDLKNLVIHLERILNNVPTVDKYEKEAIELTKRLNSCYNIVGVPNLFWHPIKNIDPTIYGKAQTFLKQVFQLFETMHDVAQIMKEMGKIREYETLSILHTKCTVLIDGKFEESCVFECSELEGKIKEVGNEKIYIIKTEII